MKIFFFRHGNKYELFRKDKQDILERILFTVFIGLFTLVIFSQLSILGLDSSSLTAAKDTFEGTPLGIEEYLYTSGYVDLRLMSGDKDPNLIVMINGDNTATFENKVVELQVIEGDIIEIDGSNSIESDVAVCAVSDNLQRDIVGKVFTIKKNVARIMKVKIDK